MGAVLSGNLARMHLCNLCGVGEVRQESWVSMNKNSLIHFYRRWSVLLAGPVVACAICSWAAADTYTITALGPVGGASLNEMDGSSQPTTGWAYTSGGYANAILSAGGSTTLLGTLGGNSSSGEAVNSAGQVTGWADTASGVYQAFLYSNGQMTDLGTLGGSYSNGMAINDLGDITGWAHNSSGYYNAFVYSAGSMIDLGTLGGTSSIGYAINDLGQVTGWAYSSDKDERAFLYTNGSMIDLNTVLSPDSGWTLLGATGINNAGQITGFGVYDGLSQAYLLTPNDPPAAAAPLPSSSRAVLPLLALVGGWTILRRRRPATA